MTTTANNSEDSQWHSALLVNGFSMGINVRPAAAADHGTTVNRIVTAGNPLCGSAKSVIRRVFAPRTNLTPGVTGSGRTSSASKHVTVERFRVRSVAGLRGTIGGISGGGKSKLQWSRAVQSGFPNSEGCFEREPLRIPFITFPRFEESCLRRKNLRLCQQKHLTGKPSCSPSNRGRFFPSPSASSLSIATSSLASPGNQGPLTSELIPEKYHSLRDAKTYAELRRILDRNGKYLSRANIVVEASQGQCNQWQQRQGNGQTLLVTRDHDDGANSTCSEFWSGFNDGGGGSPGSATISATRQRVRKRERQLSRERCFDDDTALRYVRQQCATQDSSVAGSVMTKDYNREGETYNQNWNYAG